jgi:polyisoprenoid-binding protein YceI
MKKQKTFLILILSFFAINLWSQVYDSSPGSTAVVKGTSNLHDWDMELKNFTSSFQLSQEGMKVKSISDMKFSCKVKDIRSESSIMDKKAWDALRNDKQPEITFTGASISGLAAENGKFSGTANGKLSIAGQSHDVSIPFRGSFSDERTVNIDATADLTMSSFGISPPTAIMGTLKTGDKVSVTLKITYNRK